MSADFICFGVQLGWRWRSRAAAPEMCGAEKLVPSRTANGSPANSGSVDEMTCEPGAVMSGLSACPNGVRPPAEKLDGTPAQVVSTSSWSRLKRTLTAPPDPAMACRRRAPSRSEIEPPSRPEKIANDGSPPRLSATTMPTAPASRALAAFASYWQPPRETRAIAPRNDAPGRLPSQRSRLPPLPEMAPTSTSLWFAVTHEGGMLSVATNGIRPIATDGETTVNEFPKTCALVVEPTLIASGAVAGDPAVPRPKESRSFPAEMTGMTPERTTLATVGMRASVRGSACGPPPEKLMMSIPSATAASNAETISGVVPEQQPPSGSGTLNTR